MNMEITEEIVKNFAMPFDEYMKLLHNTLEITELPRNKPEPIKWNFGYNQKTLQLGPKIKHKPVKCQVEIIEG